MAKVLTKEQAFNRLASWFYTDTVSKKRNSIALTTQEQELYTFLGFV